MLTRFRHFKPETLSAFRSLVVSTIAIVVRAVDKPGETLARPCGKVEVVDEDFISHAQLGDGNLLIVPGTTDGVLEVEADHLVLVLIALLLHPRVVGVDDGRGKVNQGVQFAFCHSPRPCSGAGC